MLIYNNGLRICQSARTVTKLQETQEKKINDNNYKIYEKYTYNNKPGIPAIPDTSASARSVTRLWKKKKRSKQKYLTTSKDNYNSKS